MKDVKDMKDKENCFTIKERKKINRKLYNYYDFLIKINLSNN